MKHQLTLSGVLRFVLYRTRLVTEIKVLSCVSNFVNLISFIKKKNYKLVLYCLWRIANSFFTTVATLVFPCSNEMIYSYVVHR